jgi:CRISPR-associated exonuclease Cas4
MPSPQSPEDTEPLFLSALQHYSYCPRQCALIHQEQSFSENVHTLRGQHAHRRVDQVGDYEQDDRHIERALPLFSKHYGLTGRADVVEFLSDGTPYPVEYKHGPRRKQLHDDIQLAAQALCLEEMTGKAVPEGAIFHHSSQHRRPVSIGADLRKQTVETIAAVRKLLTSRTMPPPASDPKRCRQCSLHDLCQPEMLRAANRITSLYHDLFTTEDPPS